MLLRRSKNNPPGTRKLRAPNIIVQKEKEADNWPEVQAGVLVSLWLHN